MRRAGPEDLGRDRLQAGRSLAADQGGFVLVLVVLMLFAISVAGATGYLVVSTEATLAKYSTQGAEALSVARGGLHRFVAEQIGTLADTMTYAIGDGTALVTTRKIAQIDAKTDMYFLRSEGSVADVFTPASPARRVVGAYAYYHKSPLQPHAAWVVAADRAYADGTSGPGEVSGNDGSSDPSCPGPGVPPVSAPITGVVARLATGQRDGGNLTGTPPGETWPGGFSAVYDSVGLRWDILSDPGFPVEFDGVLPNYGALPADSFPIVRWSGYFNQGWNGRGVLIVDGELDAPSGFSWDGIVLAGSMDDIHEGTIRGMLVAGLDGPNPYTTVEWDGRLRYYSCLFNGANESLSYLELLESTLFEAG